MTNNNIPIGHNKLTLYLSIYQTTTLCCVLFSLCKSDENKNKKIHNKPDRVVKFDGDAGH